MSDLFQENVLLHAHFTNLEVGDVVWARPNCMVLLIKKIDALGVWKVYNLHNDAVYQMCYNEGFFHVLNHQIKLKKPETVETTR